MDINLIKLIADKIYLLNSQHVAVIFIITGPNGNGKTIFTKQLLTKLPFHQTFNLGAVAKTIRFAYRDAQVTRLENFTSKKITSLFTPITQFACSEYRKNGVNVIVDGVQIDTGSSEWEKLIIGGVVLQVDEKLRVRRNQHPETHFNRAMQLELTDQLEYAPSDMFKTIDNNLSKADTLNSILLALSEQLDRQILKIAHARLPVHAVKSSKNFVI